VANFGEKVSFVRLSQDSQDVGGRLDELYGQFTSKKPNTSYGENISENFGDHRDRMAK
jgi:hypothetical protein